MTSLELREQRAKLVHDARKLIDDSEAEQRSLTAEERQTWEAMMADVDSLEGKIEAAEASERKQRLETAEAGLSKPQGRKVRPQAPTDFNRNEYRSALRNWLLAGSPDCDRSTDANYRGQQYHLPLDSRSISLSLGDKFEARAVTKGGAGSGAELAPQDLPTTYVQWLIYLAPVLQYVTVKNTTDARDLPVPQVDDRASVGQIVGENSLIPDQDFITANVTLKAFKFTSGLQKVSREFLLSAIGNLESDIGGMLANRNARALAKYAVSGTGSGQPQGLVAAADTPFENLGTRGTLTSDNIIDLVYQVQQPYADNGTFVMHRTTAAAVRKLKTTIGSYLWQESLQAGQPPRLMGYPVLISQDMPTLSTTGANAVILFGDLSQYYVRSVDGVIVTRDDSRFMEYGLVAFNALHFLDGRWVGPSTAIAALGNPAS